MPDPDLDTARKGATTAPPHGPHLPMLRDPTTSPVPTPRRRRGLWLWGGGLLAIALALAGYFQPWANVATPVAVEIAALAPVTRVLAVNGRVAALHAVDVRSTVSGRLEALLVDEGDNVGIGETLARIDAAAQSAVVRQAMAGLDSAIVAQGQAQETYDRTLALGANVPRASLDTAERALQSATQEVSRLSALVDQAQIQLENYTIRAPIAGTVLTMTAQQGQIADPATPLLTLADLGQLVVEADVDESYATQISLGQRAVLQLAGASDTRGGAVVFVSQRVDAGTGGLAFKIGFDDGVTAPVGLTVTANIIIEERPAALTIPRAAMLSGADTSLLILRDGIAQQQAISVIDWPAARLIVTDGLTPGDVIILDPTGISPGQPVTVAQP